MVGLFAFSMEVGLEPVCYENMRKLLYMTLE